MKKKVAFFAERLDIGGIGRAIIDYVNAFDKSKYEITLFLDQNEGIYADEITSDIKIVTFNHSENKIILIRKLINLYKLLKFKIKYYNRFDFAANFTTSFKAGAVLSKYFSKNNACWIHGNYWNNVEEAKHFFKYTTIAKYKKIIFVSEEAKKKYTNFYQNTSQKLYVLNNLIDYKSAIEKSKVDLHLSKNKTVLLNVGRHEEETKKLSMLFKCIRRLIDEKYDFELWLVGDGKDTEKYKNMVQELKLENVVKFLGRKKNVFPYYKIADAIILSSFYEGNPVVYLEAKVMNKPIISTDVSDARKELDGYGIITEKNEESFYMGLKKYLDEGYEIKRQFDPEKHNKNILEKLYSIIEE